MRSFCATVYKSVGSLLPPSLITKFLVPLSISFPMHKPVLDHSHLVEVSRTRTQPVRLLSTKGQPVAKAATYTTNTRN